MRTQYAAYATICLALIANNVTAQQTEDSSSADLDSMLGDSAAPVSEAPATSPETAPAAEPQPAAAAEAPPPETTATIPVDEQPKVKPARSRNSIVEEIVVTARRKEESMQDVPITMSAFTADQLSSLGITDTRDLAKLIPGFKYADTGQNVPFYSIRGVGFDASSQVANSTVGLYFDEFNLPFPVLTKGPNLDLQRTEILKGPQGTLFGRNTTAGAVNYITQQPTEEFKAGISGSYGRFRTSDVEGFISGPVTSTLGMRFAVRKIDALEGWQYSLTRPNDKLGKKDKLSARFVTKWTPSDTVDVTGYLDYWQDKSDAQAAQALVIRAANQQDVRLSSRVRNLPPLGLDNRNIQVSDFPVEETENLPKWQFNDRFGLGRLRADWQVLDNASLIYLGSYGEFKEKNAGIPQSGLSVPNFESRFFVKTTYWNQELRLAGKWGDEIGYVTGVFVSHDDVDNLFTGFAKTSSALFPHDLEGNSTLVHFADLIGKQSADSYAGFANLDWQFLPAFRTTLGLRYTRDIRDFSGCSRDNPEDTAMGPGLAGIFNVLSISSGGTGGAMEGDCVTLDDETHNPGLVSKSLSEGNLSGKLSLDWKPADNALLYLTYSRGFKSGSFNVITAAEERQYTPATQEQVDALELGTKLTLLDSYQLNIAGFYYDYRDKQLLGTVINQVFGPLPLLVNAPRSRVRGLELELRAEPVTNLTLLLSGVYLETEILEYTGLNEFGENTDFSGNGFSYAPYLTATTSANYRVLLPRDLELTPGVSVNYSGESSASNGGDPLFDLPSFTNVDASVGLGRADGAWLVRLWSYNLLNEYQPLSAGSARSGDSISRYVQMPRTYGISFKYTL